VERVAMKKRRQTLSTNYVGQVLGGRYYVLRCMGIGGMGSVYHAHDRELDEPVALKIVHAEYADNAAFLERFRHEVKLARRVTHVNVARTFEINSSGGVTYLTMELVDGESLLDRLLRGPVPTTEALAITRAMCAGLAAAHKADVVHRDIKPANILIAHDGRVVLADFGIAAIGGTTDRSAVGTPVYMAPEQALGEEVTAASDIYSLGLVLYEMLVGHPPFSGTLPAIRAAKDVTPFVSLRASDPETQQLATVIARATARNPADRFGSANELLQMLDVLGPGHTREVPALPEVDAVALRTVLVAAPRISKSDRSHCAHAVYQRLLELLGDEPGVRLTSVSEPDSEPALVIELDASDYLSVAIAADPRITLLSMNLSLDIAHIEASANALLGAVRTVLHPAVALPLEALDLLLRARSVALTSYEQALHARELLVRADAIAPEQPRIIATLAIVETQLAFYATGPDTGQVDRAKRCAERALRMQPASFETQLAAGKLELNIGDAPRAARYFRGAIAAAPHASEPHVYLGRMLLEAGFLPEAQARLHHGAILDPRSEVPSLELARAYALQGDWSTCDRLLLDAQTKQASWAVLIARTRVYLWRRDVRPLEAAREQLAQMTLSPFVASFFKAATVVVDGTWERDRDELVRMASSAPSTRRRAINAQFVAELAALHGDLDTCEYLLGAAVTAGLFDLHWLERCPLLVDVKHRPSMVPLVAEVQQRANAVLDALYGDVPSSNALAQRRP
jgi:eukaryotic-like serine/threonine-protein kinase